MKSQLRVVRKGKWLEIWWDGKGLKKQKAVARQEVCVYCWVYVIICNMTVKCRELQRIKFLILKLS